MSILRSIKPNFALYDVREFFRLPPYPGTKTTLKRLLNLYTVRFQKMRAHPRLRGYPIMLTIEAANVCNLSCPACFTGAGDTSRTKAHFPMPLYEQLMDELGDYLWQLELHNWGEPLLNKNIPDLIKMATDRGIGTTISTNFSFPFSEERSDALVASGLTTLGVSLDGTTQEVYEQYRRKGNLEQVLNNVRQLVASKRKLGSTTPRMIWEFHVFEHNIHQVDEARAMAEELGMDIDVSKGWVVGNEWDPDGQYKFFQAPSVDGCEFLWQRAVVNIDGGVSPCCGTFFREDDFATMEQKSFQEAWNSRKFQLARKLFSGRDDSPEAKALVCHDCPETITRQEYLDHMAAGGARIDFRGHFTSNDGFNFFFSRKPGANGMEPRETIPLEPVVAERPTPNKAS